MHGLGAPTTGNRVEEEVRPWCVAADGVSPTCRRPPMREHTQSFDPRCTPRREARQPDVGNIGTPYVIRSYDSHAAQQVRVHLVAWVLNRCAWAGRHARQPKHAHQSLHMLAVDRPPLPLEDHDHSPAAIERMARELLIDQRAKIQIIVVGKCHGAGAIYRRPGHASQLALARQRYLVAGLDPSQPHRAAYRPDFFLR